MVQMKKYLIVVFVHLFVCGGLVFTARTEELPPDIMRMRPYENRLPTKIDNWRGKQGEFPGAEKTDFDDSGWEKAGPGTNWQGRGVVYWFRTELVLPPASDGKPVFLHFAINDGGEVFADGEKIETFSNNTRVLLTESATAGRKITLAVKAINSGGSGAFTFAGYKIVNSKHLITIEKAVSKLNGLAAAGYAPVSGWKFMAKPGKGPASPGTHDEGWQPVTLSHTWDSTDPNGWYRAWFIMPDKVNGFPVEGGPFWLDFGVRDTGDLYVQGRRVKNIVRSGSLDATGKLSPGDKVLLAVKVANLTGYGSLKNARIHAGALDPVMEAARGLISDLRRASAMFEQIPEPPAEVVSAVESACWKAAETAESKDIEFVMAGLEKARGELSTVEKFLEIYPIFHIGPYLQNVKEDGITIMWETLVPADSAVYYGREGKTEKIVDPEKKLVHEITIEGLDRETEYNYVAVSGGQASPIGTFQTKIHRETPFSFAVWGDNRTDPATHESVINSMLQFEPDIALNVGDVVTTGVNYEEWSNEYFLPIRRLATKVPTYIAIGNHEYGGYGCGNPVVWFERFVNHPPPNKYYFSFTYGNSYFMILNPQEEAACYDVRPGSEQYEWMLKQFESDEYRNASFRFVFFHEPPYSEGWSGGYYDGEASLRAHLVPLFEKYDMDIVFAGHTHDYERGQWPEGDGPYYIITGGGGSSLDDTKYKEWEQIDIMKFIYHFCLVKIEEKSLEFKAIDRNGEVFDSFEIHH